MKNTEDTFRFFIRKNWVEAGKLLDNESIDNLGITFHEYLNDTIDGATWEKIVPKNALDVMYNMDNPTYTNGFHPAYMLHFTEFVRTMNEEMEQEMKRDNQLTLNQHTPWS